MTAFILWFTSPFLTAISSLSKTMRFCSFSALSLNTPSVVCATSLSNSYVYLLLLLIN
jgi:hypothetical protein